MRAPVVGGAVALTLLGGCGVRTTVSCSLVGGDSGIAVVVDKEYAPMVASGTLRLCSPACHDYPLDLRHAFKAHNPAAGLLQNGVKFQRILLPDLEDRQVTLSLTLRSKSGKVVIDASREVTPSVSYPNGNKCEPRVVSVLVHVDATGTVAVTPDTRA